MDTYHMQEPCAFSINLDNTGILLEYPNASSPLNLDESCTAIFDGGRRYNWRQNHEEFYDMGSSMASFSEEQDMLSLCSDWPLLSAEAVGRKPSTINRAWHAKRSNIDPLIHSQMFGMDVQAHNHLYPNIDSVVQYTAPLDASDEEDVYMAYSQYWNFSNFGSFVERPSEPCSIALPSLPIVGVRGFPDTAKCSYHSTLPVKTYTRSTAVSLPLEDAATAAYPPEAATASLPEEASRAVRETSKILVHTPEREPVEGIPYGMAASSRRFEEGKKVLALLLRCKSKRRNQTAAKSYCGSSSSRGQQLSIAGSSRIGLNVNKPKGHNLGKKRDSAVQASRVCEEMDPMCETIDRNRLLARCELLKVEIRDRSAMLSALDHKCRQFRRCNKDSHTTCRRKRISNKEIDAVRLLETKKMELLTVAAVYVKMAEALQGIVIEEIEDIDIEIKKFQFLADKAASVNPLLLNMDSLHLQSNLSSPQPNGPSRSEKNEDGQIPCLKRVLPYVDDTASSPEEAFCFCGHVSIGSMISCDNKNCLFGKRFHFACVGLVTKPKGKWRCPGCTRDDEYKVVWGSILRKRHCFRERQMKERRKVAKCPLPVLHQSSGEQSGASAKRHRYTAIERSSVQADTDASQGSVGHLVQNHTKFSRYGWSSKALAPSSAWSQNTIGDIANFVNSSHSNNLSVSSLAASISSRPYVEEASHSCHNSNSRSGKLTKVEAERCRLLPSDYQGAIGFEDLNVDKCDSSLSIAEPFKSKYYNANCSLNIYNSSKYSGSLCGKVGKSGLEDASIRGGCISSCEKGIDTGDTPDSFISTDNERRVSLCAETFAEALPPVCSCTCTASSNSWAYFRDRAHFLDYVRLQKDASDFTNSMNKASLLNIYLEEKERSSFVNAPPSSPCIFDAKALTNNGTNVESSAENYLECAKFGKICGTDSKFFHSSPEGTRGAIFPEARVVTGAKQLKHNRSVIGTKAGVIPSDEYHGLDIKENQALLVGNGASGTADAAEPSDTAPRNVKNSEEAIKGSEDSSLLEMLNTTTTFPFLKCLMNDGGPEESYTGVVLDTLSALLEEASKELSITCYYHGKSDLRENELNSYPEGVDTDICTDASKLSTVCYKNSAQLERDLSKRPCFHSNGFEDDAAYFLCSETGEAKAKSDERNSFVRKECLNHVVGKNKTKSDILLTPTTTIFWDSKAQRWRVSVNEREGRKRRYKYFGVAKYGSQEKALSAATLYQSKMQKVKQQEEGILTS